MKLLSFLLLLIFFSCSRKLDPITPNNNGTVSIAIKIDRNISNIRMTKSSKLFMKICNVDGNNCFDTTININENLLMIRAISLESGDNYSLLTWTEDDTGDTISLPNITTFLIQPNIVTSLPIEITPNVGTIRFNISSIPTKIDSIKIVFDADSGLYNNCVKRESYTIIDLDNIPYNSKGTLSLITIDSTASTTVWDSTFTFINQNFSGTFSTVSKGELTASITVEETSTSVFTGALNGSDNFDENGNVIITEILATGGSKAKSKEFIELYNISDQPIIERILKLEINGKEFSIDSFSIDSNSYAVITSDSCDFISSNYHLPFDFVSTKGLIKVFLNDRLEDYLFYENNSMGKLSYSAKRSWALDKDVYSSTENNILQNWCISKDTLFSDSTAIWYGTPGY